MSDCCQSLPQAETTDRSALPKRLNCPACGHKGKSLSTVTLKCLLKAEAMSRLEPEDVYQFCPEPVCTVVYYNLSKQFSIGDLQVPVFQKDLALDTPVCYCFGFTRRDLQDSAGPGCTKDLAARVQEFVQAGKCACEFRNPQGRCCLGNITGAKQNHAN